jgi:hypothetical protein
VVISISCQGLIPAKVKDIYKNFGQIVVSLDHMKSFLWMTPIEPKMDRAYLYNYPDNLRYIFKLMSSSIQLIFKFFLNDFLGWWDL